MLTRAAWAIIGACGLVIGATVLVLAFEPARSMVGLSGMKPSYRAGDILNLDFAGSERARRTVLVFSRADCGACVKSKDELAALSSRLAGRDVRVMLVTHGGARPAAVVFGMDVGIPASQIVALESTALHILRVPALAVVDQHGRILMYTEGTLTPEGREQALNAAG